MTYDLYRLLALGWMLPGLFVFIFLFKINAPFGRHVASGWGLTIDNRLGWFLMEFVVLAVLFVFLATGQKTISWTTGVLCGFFVAHYLHRSLIFPWQINTPGKRMPLVIVLSAITFNTMNGFLIGYYFGNFADYPPDWLGTPRFWVGLALFAGGMAINIRSDYRLIRLRAPGETGYKIPRGGLFEYVSCPNHLGEIVEWIGFAVMSWSLPGAVFAFWTFANLAPRALAHHAWYRQNFPDYPEARKALVPGLW